jgi:alpha-mannosidase
VLPIATDLSSSDSIAHAIARLRQLTQVDLQAGWHFYTGDLPQAAATQATTWQDWPQVSLNDKGHIAWSQGRTVLWLGQRLRIPDQVQGYSITELALRLAVRWWANQGQLFVDGVLVQEGDIFDCTHRILLTTQAKPGAEFAIALRLVSPSHDPGALVRSHAIYERFYGADQSSSEPPCPEPGFVADELAVLHHYLHTFQPAHLDTMNQIMATHLDWANLSDRPTFDASLSQMREHLQPLAKSLKQRQIYLLGHAHLDMAWLWPVAETWQAAEQTFKSVLQLQQAFPELIFCHSTPALYQWIEQHRPELFAAIQQQIAAGQWEVVAGLWVEPDFNLISGESLVRQILYGQRYTRNTFGQVSAIAWVPDSFGFCWQLPQLLTQGGVRYFVTQKLRWNDTNPFPYEWFWWRSPNGSQILSFNSPPIGESIDPLAMIRYACDWETKTGIPTALWLPGVGDHGGGPTRDMLETAQRWQQSPFFPQLQFTTALQYLQTLETSPPSSPSLPHWHDELYLEFHRGCYTTHANQKAWNRRCERLLYQAELFASIATLVAQADYPDMELQTAWKQVLFNQFHDILPGSAIAEVYQDANQDWQRAEQTAQQILKASLKAIASQLSLPQPPLAGSYPLWVFNPLNWERSQVLAIDLAAIHLPTLPPSQRWQVYDQTGQPLLSQPSSENGSTTMWFTANSIPGLGYRLFWLSPVAERSAASPTMASTPTPSLSSSWILENERLSMRVNPDTGDLDSVYDKIHQREVLAGPGNQLQTFTDQGQYWDAWNIDPYYADHPLPPPVLISIVWVEQGPLVSSLRVVRQIGTSACRQDYTLYAGSPLLVITTTIDWQERHTLLKAAFPLQLTADHATYEIPFAAIKRPTHPDAIAQTAKWEVPALQWGDLSDSDYGVSLLNTCKYGYDSQPTQIRLTLLRSPTWPDPQADQGEHHFTYALYPHPGDWRSAQTPRYGYELNQPLLYCLSSPYQSESAKDLPPSGQFLNLDNPQVVVSTFKRSEDNANAWIIRGYESQGQATQIAIAPHSGLLLQHSLDPATAQITNLLEDIPSGVSPPQANPRPFKLNPWEVFSLQIKTRAETRISS